MKKKIKKKAAKKKAPPKGKSKAKALKPVRQSQSKPVGVVTHFFGNIKVAIVKFKKPVKVGAKLNYKGATTDFEDTVKSMQFNHESIAVAKKGKQIGIKVKKRVREGDMVYESK